MIFARTLWIFRPSTPQIDLSQNKQHGSNNVLTPFTVQQTLDYWHRCIFQVGNSHKPKPPPGVTRHWMPTQNYLIIVISKNTNDTPVAKRGAILKSELMAANCSFGMRCEVIAQNIHFINFGQEAILKESRMEGLDTLFCLTVMDYQWNVHLCKGWCTLHQVGV